MNKFYLLLLFCVILFKANGQAGSLDSTFGNNGIQTTAFLNKANTLDEQGRVVLANKNGNVFVVVQVGDNNTGIVKYLPDDKLDSSYGNAGYSNTVKDLNVFGAAIQGDNVIVAGYAQDEDFRSFFALARFTAAGVLDSAFGNNGKVITEFNGYSQYATSIALQGNKIIVGGDINSNFALIRYTANGTLDSSFGVNGIVITDFNKKFQDNATSMVLQGDKILLGGNANVRDLYLGGDFALARYTADGVLDSTFGVNGKVTTDFDDSHDVATSIALQENKIIVAGSIGTIIYSDFALIRYTADGILDSSFGVNGKVTTDFSNREDRANSIVLQGGKIIAAGFANDINDHRDFALARYTADGTLDSIFGGNGKITTDVGSDNEASNSPSAV